MKSLDWTRHKELYRNKIYNQAAILYVQQMRIGAGYYDKRITKAKLRLVKE